MKDEHMLMYVLVFVLGFMVARMLGGHLIEGDTCTFKGNDKSSGIQAFASSPYRIRHYNSIQADGFKCDDYTTGCPYDNQSRSGDLCYCTDKTQNMNDYGRCVTPKFNCRKGKEWDDYMGQCLNSDGSHPPEGLHRCPYERGYRWDFDNDICVQR